MHDSTRDVMRRAAGGGILPGVAGWRGVASAMVVLAVLAVVTGCGDDDPTPSDAGTPSLSAPPQSGRATAEQEALAAYRGMWQAYAKAGLSADPDEPDLARYAADGALRTLTDGLKSYRDKDQVLKGDLVTGPQVASASPDPDPTTVTITDCLNTTEFLVYEKSGDLANDVPGGRRSAKATVTDLGADGWKVTSFGVQAVNTC